ncbi:MAG: RluA family pseudouridine synthase [Alphaproteobacteria bacterium]|nr:RluA family pseudouridine synthase [Alphaproteobacteria bacterium]
MSTSLPAAKALIVESRPAEAGERLDRVLVRGAGAELSRSRIQALIAEGAVHGPEGVIGDPARRVKADERFTVMIPVPAAAKPEAQDIPLNVVYEDDALIIVDKPAGLVVHPAAGNADGTLVNALLHHCRGQLAGIGGEARPGIVHRIDKDTSGLLVAAKTDKALRSLGKQFAAHVIERMYVAFVWGAPFKREGRIEGDIGRSHFERTKMVVRAGGKPAVTHYQVVRTFGPPVAPVAARIHCRLETGRTHQIRVHMTHIGHPLIGDPSYGRARTAAAARKALPPEALAVVDAFSRQALHAAVLGFQHPTTHKVLRFESALPEDMTALEAALAQAA